MKRYEKLTSWSSCLLCRCANRDVMRIFGINLSSLEAPWFIHVNPYAVVLGLLVEIIESLEPHVGALVIEPVYEDSDFGPHLVDEVVVVCLIVEDSRLNKYIIEVALRVVLIVKLLCRDGSINNGDEVLAVRVQVVS